MRMKLSTITGFLLLSTLTLPLSASIQITQRTNSAVKFQFTLSEYTVDSLSQSETRLGFNSANSSVIADDGSILPAHSFYVGIAQTGTPAVSFTATKTVTIALNHRLQRIPDSEMKRRKRVPDQQTQKPVFDSRWISNPEYLFFRTFRTARFFIVPFFYDSSIQSLTVLLEGFCTITLPAADNKLRTPSFAYSGSDYERMVQELVINYDQSRQWAATPAITALRSQRFKPSDTVLSTTQRMGTFSIGDGTYEINEGTTNENGIVKITLADIALALGKAVPISSVRLYASRRADMNPLTPSLDSAQTPTDSFPAVVEEVPLYRGSDYVLAYVTGTSDWYYAPDTTIRNYEFMLNHFDAYRHYWIKAGGNGLNMLQFTSTATPTATVTSFENRMKFKKSLKIRSNDGNLEESKGGKEWVWDYLHSKGSSNFHYRAKIDDLIPGTPGFFRINTGYRQGPSDQPIITGFFGKTLFSDTGSTIWYPVSAADLALPQVDINRIDIPGFDIFYEIIDFDVRYRTSLDMTGRKSLRIYSDSQPAIVTYQLTNCPAVDQLVVVRIPGSDSAAVQLVGMKNSGATSFSWVDTAGIGVQYFVSTGAGLLSPKIDSVLPRQHDNLEISDLHGTNNSSDFLIITAALFKDQARRLVQHKAAIGRFSKPAVVDITDVFQEFGGGSRDPASLRNFLAYVMQSPTWQMKPDYVVLFGNGHYDYKNNTSSEVNFIPPYETKHHCIEDFFSCTKPGANAEDSDAIPAFFMGRLPCVNQTEAQVIVDKIVETEGAEADFGPWRNKFLLVSDDDRQGENKVDNLGHYLANERVAYQTNLLMPALEIRKVMEFEYPYNTINLKPEATQALLSEINNGVSCVNYFGHGSESAWADEYIFQVNDIWNLKNKKRYPMINSFSCSVAYFDQPNASSLSDKLITLPNAGAIATLASTRIAYANSNEIMAKTYYNHLYNKALNFTIGQAYQMTKSSLGDNNLKSYVLLGDPSIRFVTATDTVETQITDTNGIALSSDTLKALQQIIVKGSVKRNGAVNTQFGTAAKPANIRVALFNPDQDSVRRKDGGTMTNPVYSLPGKPVYTKDNVPVVNGLFEQKIALPRRLTYKKAGVRLLTYAWDSTRSIGIGIKNDLIFKGSEGGGGSNNTQGPTIAVRPVYENDSLWGSSVGVSSITTMLPLTCEIKLFDENGLDVAGEGPDEGLTVEISRVLDRQNINGKFIFDAGEFTRGKAIFILDQSSLLCGRYDLTVTAQDLLGNTSVQTIALEIIAEQELSLGQVFTYPNPVHRGSSTRF
ncbi:MAG: hypothetical protein JW795_17795, partial [Chitinivibrionales bacterium]|nr:hypothetical protein [Chitinivibrionales bacterium]